jgi:hypothetical protein
MWKVLPAVIVYLLLLHLLADSLAKFGLELQVVPVVPVGVHQQTPLRVMVQLDKDIQVVLVTVLVTVKMVMVAQALPLPLLAHL